MSRHANLILAILSAAAFYFFFGVIVSEYLVTEAYRSIVSGIRVVAAVIAIGLIAIALVRFARGSNTE